MSGKIRTQIKMSLPEVIEIVPLVSSPEMEITVPGSKSITNRSLILAALSNGVVTLENALWSEDTQVMVDALRLLGYKIEVNLDPAEPGNRNLIIEAVSYTHLRAHETREDRRGPRGG